MPFLKVRHFGQADYMGTKKQDTHILNDGDTVKVRWPDKTESDHKVKVKAEFVDCGLMGDYTDKHSYIIVDHHGKKIEMPLEGLVVYVVKRKSKQPPKVVPKWP